MALSAAADSPKLLGTYVTTVEHEDEMRRATKARLV